MTAPSSFAERRAALRKAPPAPAASTLPAHIRPTIGASEVAVVLGLQRRNDDGEPYTSELELWARLTGGLPRYDSASSSPDAEVGRWMEPAILERLRVELRTVIVPGPTLDRPGFVDPAGVVPWHARPDGLAPMVPATIEVKAPLVLDPDRWGPDGGEDMPPEYLVQVLAQVAVAYAIDRVEVGALGAMARAPGWFGCRRTWAGYRYRRDPVRERAVIERVTRWLDEHVIGGMPPQPDGSGSASRALRSMFATTHGEDLVRVATPTDLEHFRRLLGCRTAMDEIRARQEESRQRLQLAMGPATELRTPDGELCATWRPTKVGTRRFVTKDTRTTVEID